MKLLFNIENILKNEKMNEFITSYGISFTEFRELCKETGAIISGSVSLYLYLKQQGLEPGFEPNNINIWVTNKALNKTDTLRIYEYSNCFISFLEMYGYINMNSLSYTDEKHHNNIDSGRGNITICLEHLDNKHKIYITIINALSAHDYVMNTGLLNICSIIWNAEYDSLFHANSISINKKQMYINRDFRRSFDSLTINEKDFISKYKNRGFEFTNNPDIIGINFDHRIISRKSELHNQNIFDLFDYEEFSIAEYIRLSKENIIIKTGEQYSGFNRFVFIDYLQSKDVILDGLGNVCSTPLNQTIHSMYIDLFKNREYSIYELQPYYTVFIEGVKQQTYSLHSILCYSANSFENKQCLKEALPPILKKKPIEPYEDFGSNIEENMLSSYNIQTDLYTNNRSLTDFIIRNL